MAQTGETVYVPTAGIPSVGETGETVFLPTAGIPSAWTEEEIGGNAPTGALYGPLVGPLGGPI